MSYLDLHAIKLHLNIEESYDGDDFILLAMRDASEEALAKTLDCDLTQLQDSTGALPAALNHAMLLLIGTWYAQRESISTINYSTVPHTFEMLADLYHDYRPISSK